MNGELLARLRETAGVSQADLAVRVRMQPSRLSGIENGRFALTTDAAQNLANTIEAMRQERERNHVAARRAFRRALTAIQAATR